MEKAICPKIFPGKPRGYIADFRAEKGFSPGVFHNVQNLRPRIWRKNDREVHKFLQKVAKFPECGI